MSKEKHDKIKDRNKLLIKENMKLYRQLRLLEAKDKRILNLQLRIIQVWKP
jgi:hypothetical protein